MKIMKKIIIIFFLIILSIANIIIVNYYSDFTISISNIIGMIDMIIIIKYF